MIESSQTVKKLEEKHPKSTFKPVYNCPSDIPDFALDENALMQQIRNAPRGSGSGPSGWRCEHLRPLIHNANIKDLLFFVCSSIAKGQLPSEASSLLSASRLIALHVRPIAVGEVLRRITAKTMCAKYRESFSQFFSPVQQGVCTSYGVEILIHHLQLLVEHNPNWVTLKSDVRNAFISISRQSLMSEVSSCFPELYNHVFAMYGHFSQLVYAEV